MEGLVRNALRLSRNLHGLWAGNDHSRSAILSLRAISLCRDICDCDCTLVRPCLSSDGDRRRDHGHSLSHGSHTAVFVHSRHRLIRRSPGDCSAGINLCLQSLRLIHRHGHGIPIQGNRNSILCCDHIIAVLQLYLDIPVSQVFFLQRSAVRSAGDKAGKIVTFDQCRAVSDGLKSSAGNRQFDLF